MDTHNRAATHVVPPIKGMEKVPFEINKSYSGWYLFLSENLKEGGLIETYEKETGKDTRALKFRQGTPIVEVLRGTPEGVTEELAAFGDWLTEHYYGEDENLVYGLNR